MESIRRTFFTVENFTLPSSILKFNDCHFYDLNATLTVIASFYMTMSPTAEGHLCSLSSTVACHHVMVRAGNGGEGDDVYIH